MIDFRGILEPAANVATAIGVVVATWQIRQSKQQAQSNFEDSLNAQYRALLAELPLEALLGRRLEDDTLKKHLPVFYRYFDLSNEQAFLHERRRVRSKTWANWREGIEQNMARPAFWRAWEILHPDLDGSFDELKRVIREAERAKRLRSPDAAPKRVEPPTTEIG